MEKPAFSALPRLALPRICGVIIVVLMMSVSAAKAQTFSWSALGLADEATVPTGSTIVAGGVTMTVTTTFTTDGGVTTTTYGASAFSYENSVTFGGLSNYLEVGFDNDLCDQDDTFSVLLSFSSPVNNLQFTISDVDQSSWDDIIEINFNGQNIKGALNDSATGDPLLTLGADVQEDDEIFADGYEGTVSVPSANTTGNIVFDSTGVSTFAFNSVEVIYFSGDDGTGCGGDPAAQRIGIGDISFSGTTVPVTLGYFKSSLVSSGALIEWQTVQEVGHAGFQIYGKQPDGWVALSDGLIERSSGDALKQSSYRYVIDSIDESIEWLSLVDVSLNEEVVPHGPYRLGQEYGSQSVQDKAYDWSKVFIRKQTAKQKQTVINKRLQSFLQADEMIEREGSK